MSISVQSESGSYEIIIEPKPAHQIKIELPGVQGGKGSQGDPGPDGISAYEVAVANGFVGSEADWLASLEGGEGPPGPPGLGGLVDIVSAGAGIDVDATDPTAPIVSLSAGAQASLEKADAAVQPDDLPPPPVNADWDATEGLAVILNKPEFATAAQGAKADSALQPEDVGSAAFQGASAFATAAQGSAADSALQPVAIGVAVQPFDVDTAKTDLAQTFTAPQRVSFTTLTYGATVTPDLDGNNAFIMTMTGNPTIANPSNMEAALGQEVLFVFRGAFQPSFGSFFKFPGGEAPTFEGSLNAIGGVVISSTELIVHGAAGYA